MIAALGAAPVIATKAGDVPLTRREGKGGESRRQEGEAHEGGEDGELRHPHAKANFGINTKAEGGIHAKANFRINAKAEGGINAKAEGGINAKGGSGMVNAKNYSWGAISGEAITEPGGRQTPEQATGQSRAAPSLCDSPVSRPKVKAKTMGVSLVQDDAKK